MRTHHRAVLLAIVLLGRVTTGTAQVAVPASAPQNPSPMVETAGLMGILYTVRFLP